ncbi:retrovirus-related pol polyprotein from transposon TNT 1-94 [Tanacetum coccineum]
MSGGRYEGAKRVSIRGCHVEIHGNNEAVGGEQKDYNTLRSCNMRRIKDLEGDDLLLHDAEMEVMNMILLSIPNEIYNSVDACTLAKDMWKRVEPREFGNTRRNNRRAYVQEEVVKGMNAPKETGNVQRTLRTPSSGNTSTAQCYNCSGKGHYARNCLKPRVHDSKYFMEQMLLAKQDEAGVIRTDEQNDFLFADASRMEEIEELSVNICLMARIQPADHTSDEGPSYDS